MRRFVKMAALCLALALCLSGCGGQEAAQEEEQTLSLTNVSYDPTREFYAAYNEMSSPAGRKRRARRWKSPSPMAARAPRPYRYPRAWRRTWSPWPWRPTCRRWPTRGSSKRAGWTSSPAERPLYLGHRVPGAQRQSPEYPRLGRPGPGGGWSHHPNPKTSGGARWNFLAAWAYGEIAYDGDQAQIEDLLTRIYQNVLVLDSGARGSTTSFVENGQGDVLIAWENEAYLTLQEYPEGYEIVTPSVSILCQPSVAVVDEVANMRGTQELATAYLEGLYSPEAQHLAAQYYYRPSDQTILQEYGDVFDLNIQMTNIEHFGGWAQAQERFFADGGIFDQIYEK